jgi:ketosteroid isomerase-like protein
VDCQQQIDTVNQFMAHVNKGDYASATAFMHEDVRLVEPSLMPYAGTYVGRQAFIDLMKEIMQLWSSWRDSPYPYELACVGTRVFKEANFKATIRANGAQVEMPFLEVLEFRDDKIAEIRPYYFDPSKIAEAMNQPAENVDA